MKKITVEAQINETIHYALQQNCIAMISSLVITNSSDEAYTDITVKVSFQPEFAVPYEVTINCLKPNEPVELSPIRIVPSMEYLVSLTEEVEGKLTIEVKEAQECIWSETWQVGILAYDQWTGINYLPEMVAAYVTPMHPKVTEVVKSAERYLKAWGNVERFTGYQTKHPEHVEEQMKAVYTALQDCELELEVPTVSYETSGQRLHLPEMVVEEGKGTALELSLLYISCLEAIGLNPMLVFLRGHVFPGCHMEEESLVECVEEDIAVLLAKNEDTSAKILLIECTDIIRDHCVDFMQAKKDAREHISNTEMFIFAIDIKGSRISGICPLPLRIQKDGRYVTVDVITNKTSDMSEEFLGYNYSKKEETNESNEQAKFKLWERKLLDLSLRNTLLNFRKTKATVQLMAANLFELEDQIVSGEQYTIMSKPKDSANMRNGLNIYPVQKDVEYIEAIATSEFTNRRIRTFLEKEELGEVLKNIYRQAHSSIEENGVNTLYLALGFLQWCDSKQSKEVRYAPLVLIPVEIMRREPADTYTIQIRDEEVQMNMVLLEMLHREYNIDISGLNPLPMDECGVDLSCVFREVRKGIEGKANWNVEEYAFLGLFSFNQFILWRDIHNRADELKNNKLVASLLSGKLEWTPQNNTMNTKQLDEQTAPVNEAILLHADSSQLDAIYTASKGQSFVLQGPPGTGKSQTIVNIITDALFHDKTVLFVAQKKTALSVVWNRLEKLGLGSFCFELHSDKVQKTELLSKLNQVLQIGKAKASGEYEQTAIQVQILRQELNQVVEAIHKKREYGMSLLEAISRYEAHKQYKDILTIDDICVTKLKEGTYEEWLEHLRQCKRASEECREGIHNVFRYYKNPNYSLELRENFATLCREFGEALLQVEENCHEFERALGIQMEGKYSNYKAFAELLDCLSSAKYQIDSLMLESENEKKEKNMSDIIACGKEYVSLERELAQIFEVEIYEYDVSNAYAEWKQASSKWLLRRIVTQSKLLKELRAYAKTPLDIDKHTITIWYNKIIKRFQLRDYLTSLDTVVTGHFSYQWQGLHTNWEMLELALQDTLQLRGALSEITLEREDAITAIQKLGKLVALNGQKKEYLQNEIWSYLECWQLCMVKEVELAKQYEAEIDSFHQEANWIARTREELVNWQNHIGELRDWSNLLQQVEQVRSYGFHSVADAFLLGERPTEEIIKSFICNVNLSIIKRTIVAEPILMDFQGVKFEDTIKQYQEVTDEFEKLATIELIAKLSGRIPKESIQGDDSLELGILKKAINDAGRMTTIRELFAQTQRVITRICPCMLVSPASAAQYLDESFNKFDYVIFDEASQIPTCEAVGVVARGENAIIVGDSKQLPPTRSLRDTYYDMMNSELEDYESILDACVALPMPQKHLLWHYRSHHESLIAYSNAKYYGQRLYTYPSPNEMNSKVTFVPIEGYYDKGATKQNYKEAVAIVKEICNRLLDSKQRNNSIGVVTFSLAQQYLIEDLLEKELGDNQILTEIQKDMSEPILIKHVESVQGEERDVILLSVGYGADKEGKLSMNFGTLNRADGYRRLNVAISRARKEMQVYSTIMPEQMELARTRFEGVAGLKGFLTYAKNGRNAITYNKEDALHRDNTLIKSIAKQIEQMGYKTRCSIGWSKHTVDIAVINPKDENAYILGILLSGDLEEMNTVREHNLLQTRVLTELGWSLHSIWILDWLDNPNKVLNKVKTSIDKAMKDKPATAKVITNNTKRVRKDLQLVNATKAEEIAVTMEQTAIVKTFGSQEDFYQSSSDTQIRKVIMDIVKREAPISKKLLMKKIASSWNITRLGNKVENRLTAILQDLRKTKAIKKTIVGDMSYYWRKDQNPERYTEYRIATEEKEKRNMEDIPPYEIANAMKEIIASQISLSKSDMIRETAKLFGFSRIGALMEAACTAGIDEAERKGYLLFDKETEQIMIRD